MRKSLVLSTLVLATILVPFATAARGQGNLAIVDLNYIYEKYEKFLQASDSLKQEAQAASEGVNRRTEGLRQKAARRDELKKHSADWDLLNQQITKEDADLQADMRIMTSDFARKETKLYYTTYMEIINEVDAFANHNKLTLVLRFNGEPIGENPEQTEVQRYLNRAVLFHHPDIDVTGFILQALRNRYQQGTQVGAGQHGPRINRN